MDATRSDKEYLVEMVSAVIDAGACTVNIPDTVGYAIPEEFGKLIAYLFANVKNMGDTIIATHCHNDLGLAVANSLAGIRQRCPSGGMHYQRYRRARRKHGDGRNRHGAANAQRPLWSLYKNQYRPDLQDIASVDTDYRHIGAAE